MCIWKWSKKPMLKSMNAHSMCYRHSCNKAGLWSDSKCSIACFPGGWSSFVWQIPVFLWVFISSTIKCLHPFLDTVCQAFWKIVACIRPRGLAALKSWLLNSTFLAYAAQNTVRWSLQNCLQWMQLQWVKHESFSMAFQRKHGRRWAQDWQG